MMTGPRVFRLIELAEVKFLDGFVDTIAEVQDLVLIDLRITVNAGDVIFDRLPVDVRVVDTLLHHLVALPLGQVVLLHYPENPTNRWYQILFSSMSYISVLAVRLNVASLPGQRIPMLTGGGDLLGFSDDHVTYSGIDPGNTSCTPLC